MMTGNLGQAVLFLDDLICHATPEQRDQLRRYLDSHPTPLNDQIDAAAADLRARAERAAADGRTTLRDLPVPAYPEWVRLGLLHALLVWLAGEAATCLHAPVPTRPQPVIAAAWKPGLITCGACLHLLRFPRNSAADRTCDGCGYVTTGPENSDGIWPCGALFGAFYYVVGVCRRCRFWDEP